MNRWRPRGERKKNRFVGIETLCFSVFFVRSVFSSVRVDSPCHLTILIVECLRQLVLTRTKGEGSSCFVKV